MWTPFRWLSAAGFVAAAACLLMCHPAAARWSSDPAVNLLIAGRAGGETEPIAAPTSDGGCYIGWFDSTSGNYDLYLQRLDPDGDELWPHNGIPISQHPQNTALFAWDLTVDAEDNAVLVLSDERAGADLDVVAYKVDPSGGMPWGLDGVVLSFLAGDEMGPTAAVASDGDVVVVWAWFPDSGDGGVFMQRLSPAGLPHYPEGGLRIAGNPCETPSYPRVAPSLAGDVIVCWVRDITFYTSPRHLHAQRFAPDGTAVWPNVVYVYDQVSLPVAFRPMLTADGQGGVVSAWNASEGALHTVRVQHLDAAGHEAFAHNGVKTTTDVTRHHVAPTLTHHHDTGEITVFWDERNPSQTRWGLYGQRLSATGSRQWGDEGLMYLPVDPVYKTMYRSIPCAGGAMVTWIENPQGVPAGDIVRAMRVDTSGVPVWVEPMQTIASSFSNKGRLGMVSTRGEMAVVVWEDDRNGSVDIFAQNINPDGTLGTDPSAVDEGERPEGTDPSGSLGAKSTGLLLSSVPNPFTRETLIQLVTPRPLADARLVITDPAGRIVRRFVLGDLGPGEHRVIWDGRDDEGRSISGGLYFHACGSRTGAGARGAMMLVR